MKKILLTSIAAFGLAVAVPAFAPAAFANVSTTQDGYTHLSLLARGGSKAVTGTVFAKGSGSEAIDEGHYADAGSGSEAIDEGHYADAGSGSEAIDRLADASSSGADNPRMG